MIVEDERDGDNDDPLRFDYDVANMRHRHRRIVAHRNAQPDHDIQIMHTDPDDIPAQSMTALIARLKESRDVELHMQLQRDLIANLWNTKGKW